MHYPLHEMHDEQERSMIAIGWLTTLLLNQEELLALILLDSILMESDASPLKHKLLASKLCIHVDGFIDTEMSEVPYVLIFKGCDPQNKEAIEHALFTALHEIIDEGISAALIDAAIYQLELSRLEITGDHSPFGLTLFMRCALAKQHGCQPENALQVHSLFEKLLSQIRDPHYLTGLIRTYFLDNTHRVCLLMNPDPHLAAQEAMEEKKNLELLKKNLSEEDKFFLVQQAKELKEYQKTTEEQSLDCLPKVTLDDVSPLARDFLLKEHHFGPLKVFHHECFTNHILYADLLFDLPPISDEELPYVSLLATLLSEIGSGTRSYQENLSYIQAHTGGISASCGLHLQVSDPKKARPSFNLRGKALYRKAKELFSLMRDTLLTPHFEDTQRITDLLAQLREGQVQQLNRQALRYAIQLASSGFSSAGHVGEAWLGLRYFKTIELLTKDLKAQIPRLIDILVSLKNRLFTFQNVHLVLSCSKEMYNDLKDNAFWGLSELPTRPSSMWQLDFPIHVLPSQGRLIASQLAYSAEVYEAVPYIHPHAPALTIAAILCENKVLHKRIREERGAYGCGATFSANTGHFYLHAFRDPHILQTWQTFHAAIEKIAAQDFSAQDVEEAKLGVIQQLDQPIAPGSRAMTAYSWLRKGKSKEIRQQFRDQLLALTPSEVAHAVALHLLPKKDSGVFVTFAGQDLLEKENQLLSQEKKALTILPL